MNYAMVFGYLGKILMLESVTMLPPLIIAAANRDPVSVLAFAITMLTALLVGILFDLPKKKDKNMYAREGFVIVALSWILMSMTGALPFVIGGSIPNYIDALFETISGFTTTGATILTDVEAMPMSMLFWRSFTHWLGGMGVLVLLLALTSPENGSGMSLHILRAESPGPTVDKLAPKMRYSTRILYSIYIAMTVIQIVLLAFDMPLFDAVTLTFGTAGTGGFGIRNDSIASYSAYSQTVIGVFMMLFGINFNIYYFMLLRDFRSIRKNGELKVYIGLIAVSTAVIAFNIHALTGSVGKSILDSFFQVSSIITTTGYSTVDFNLWPELSQGILLILMFTGACAGSTGGGLKISRIVLLFKAVGREMKKMLHPKCVVRIETDGKTVESETVNRVTVFFAVYMIILILSVLLLSVEGYSFKTNVTAVIACLNNIGPGLDLVGPLGGFGFLNPISKIVLMLDMLLGRLEIFPLLLLLSPATWKNR